MNLFTVKSIMKVELTKLHRNKLLYLAPLLILFMSMFSSPIRLGYQPEALKAAHYLANDLIMGSIFILPFLVVSAFLGEKKKGIKEILGLQPINVGKYLVSKCLVMVLILAVSMLLGYLVFILSPLLMGYSAYSPYHFIVVFLYRVLPTVFFYFALVILVEVISENLLMTLVFPIFYTIFAESLPSILWFRVCNVEFHPLQLGNPLEPELLRIYIINRILCFILGAVFFTISFIVYKRKWQQGKSHKLGIKFKAIPSPVSYRLQTQLTKGISGIIAIMCLISIAMKSVQSYTMCKFGLLILPALFITPLITEIYEHKREAWIVLSPTPFWKYLGKKFLSACLYPLSIITIISLLAGISGVESNLLRNISILAINSMFLAMIGFTVANITKRSYLGLFVSVLYWIMNLALGSRFSEQIWGLSIIINLELLETPIWGNMLLLGSISIILLIVNLVAVNIKERYSFKPLLMMGSLGALCLLPVMIVYVRGAGRVEVPTFKNTPPLRTIVKEEYSVRYPSILSVEKGKELLIMWETVQNELEDCLPEEKQYKDIVFTNNTEESTDDHTKVFEYHGLKYFNPSKFSPNDWFYTMIYEQLQCESINSGDTHELLVSTLSNYIYYTRVLPALEKQMSEDYWLNNYDYYRLPSYIPVYEETIEDYRELVARDSKTIKDDEAIALLYRALDEAGNLNVFIHTLQTQELNKVSELKELYESLTDEKDNNLWQVYESVAVYYDEHYGQ